MVDYSQWVEAVHEAYQEIGGEYTEGTAPELTQQAAEFWQQNKEQILELAFRAAVELAKRALA